MERFIERMLIRVVEEVNRVRGNVQMAETEAEVAVRVGQFVRGVVKGGREGELEGMCHRMKAFILGVLTDISKTDQHRATQLQSYLHRTLSSTQLLSHTLSSLYPLIQSLQYPPNPLLTETCPNHPHFFLTLKLTYRVLTSYPTLFSQTYFDI